MIKYGCFEVCLSAGLLLICKFGKNITILAWLEAGIHGGCYKLMNRHVHIKCVASPGQ